MTASPSRVNFLRHSGWFSPDDVAHETLNVIGVGATGSHIALLAAKMGFQKFRIWDDDSVEAHNLPNQAYDIEHIGMLKVEALKAVLQRFNPLIEVECHPYRFVSAQHTDLLDGPLILTVDSLAARRDIAAAFRGNPLVHYVFETRLGFNHGELNIINNLDLIESDQWRDALLDDSQVPAGPCNLQICTTLVWLIGSSATHQLCSMYAAARAEKSWSPPTTTIFSLEDSLSVFNIRKEGDTECLTLTPLSMSVT